MDIENMVERIHSVCSWAPSLPTHSDTINSKLVTCEHEYHQLKDATSLLELALWQSKTDESILIMQCNNVGQKRKTKDHTIDVKRQCRISCGASVIIPNVLSYLIVKGEEEDVSDIRSCIFSFCNSSL